MGADHTTPEPGPDKRRVSVAEASEILGITAEAVRTRIKRGKLDSIKDPPDRTGTVYVLLPVDQTRPNTDPTEQGQDRSFDQTARDELVETLREQVAYLRGVIATRDQELAQRAEEIRRRDLALEREQQLAAMFADRLRELEAPREQARSGPSGARMSPETSAGGPGATWDTWQEEPKEPSERSEQARERRESPVSSGPSEAPQPPREEAHGAAERPFTQEERPERSWWRRFFGF